MCQGTGQLIQAVRTPLGAFQQVTTCGRCEGMGQSFTACDKCGGDGRERETKRIQLTVPAGVLGFRVDSMTIGRHWVKPIGGMSKAPCYVTAGLQGLQGLGLFT